MLLMYNLDVMYRVHTYYYLMYVQNQLSYFYIFVGVRHIRGKLMSFSNRGYFKKPFRIPMYINKKIYSKNLLMYISK